MPACLRPSDAVRLSSPIADFAPWPQHRAVLLLQAAMTRRNGGRLAFLSQRFPED